MVEAMAQQDVTSNPVSLYNTINTRHKMILSFLGYVPTFFENDIVCTHSNITMPPSSTGADQIRIPTSTIAYLVTRGGTT